MKTENCAEITDAKWIELKSGLTEPVEDRQNGFIVPAGILIGLGVGLLVDHAGRRLPYRARARTCSVRNCFPLPGNPGRGSTTQAGGANVTLLLIGAVLVLAGISIVWAPAAIWTYAIAGLMILAGIGVLVRGFAKTS